MTEHEMAVLENQALSDARIVDEGNACAHKTLRSVFRSTGGMDDHETTYLICMRCGAGLVETAFYSGRYEQRAMTQTEFQRYARTQQ